MRIALYFLFFAIIGVWFGQDYGIGWDEPTARNVGAMNVKYIVLNDPAFATFPDRDYGVAFELPLVFVEQIFRLTDKHDIYLLRHLLTHLFFLFGISAAALLVQRLYQKNWLTFATFLLFLLHPRLYAHSFFNPKDIPFLSMMLCAFLAFHSATVKPNTRNYLILGICSGLLINIRLIGILVPFYAAFHLFLLVFTQKNEKIFYTKCLFTLIFSGALTLYITCPFLWHNPLGNLFFAFGQMSRFVRWSGSNLFFGQALSSAHLPWYYAPVWFGLTTPLVILGLGFLGIISDFVTFKTFFSNFKNLIKNVEFINFVLHLSIFIFPFCAVVVAHSVLYDDWRHLYFTYAGFGLLAVRGLHFLSEKNKKLPIFAVFGAVPVLIFMLENHPFSMVYFNEIPKKEKDYLVKNFDYDYWGVSYKQGLEYILNHDTAQNIKVCPNDPPGFQNQERLSPNLRKRLEMVRELRDADYFLTTYRIYCPRFKGDYDTLAPKEMHSFVVNNSKVISIFKLKK
jgi:Dolichyl-phosphate-mannose-protein mannosyltransferase